MQLDGSSARSSNQLLPDVAFMFLFSGVTGCVTKYGNLGSSLTPRTSLNNAIHSVSRRMFKNLFLSQRLTGFTTFLKSIYDFLGVARKNSGNGMHPP